MPPDSAPKDSPRPTPSPALLPNGQARLGFITTDPLNELPAVAALVSQPALAVSPENGALRSGLLSLSAVSADSLTLIYNLPDGVSATAVVKGLETEWFPYFDATPAISLGGEAVQISLAQPDCGAVEALGGLYAFPGTGAFTVTHQQALSLTLKPTNASAAPLAVLHNFAYPDQATALRNLSRDALDLLALDTPVSPPPGYQLMVYPAPELTFAAFNNDDTVLSSSQVRYALTQAVDVSALIDQVYQGNALPATGIFLPQHWGLVAGQRQFDPVAARMLLDEAGLVDRNGDGWRDDPANGQTWSLAIRVDRNSPQEVQAAMQLASFYRNLGISASVEMVPFYILIDDLLTHDYQIGLYSLPLFAALDQHNRWHSAAIDAELGANLAAYRNPTVDRLLDEANTTSNCDQSVRQALYADVQAQLTADAPIDPLVHPYRYLLVSDRLQGVQPSPFVPLTWNVAEWGIRAE